jgi:hypothetical protein
MLDTRSRVKVGFEPRYEGVPDVGVGSRLARRRHELAAELADDFLERCSMRFDALGAKALEAHIARIFGVVVTFDAVVVEHRPLFGCLRRWVAAEAAARQHRERDRGERCERDLWEGGETRERDLSERL